MKLEMTKENNNYQSTGRCNGSGEIAIFMDWNHAGLQRMADLANHREGTLPTPTFISLPASQASLKKDIIKHYSPAQWEALGKASDGNITFLLGPLSFFEMEVVLTKLSDLQLDPWIQIIALAKATKGQGSPKLPLLTLQVIKNGNVLNLEKVSVDHFAPKKDDVIKIFE